MGLYIYIHSMAEGLFVLKNGKGPYVDIITPRFFVQNSESPCGYHLIPLLPGHHGHRRRDQLYGGQRAQNAVHGFLNSRDPPTGRKSGGNEIGVLINFDHVLSPNQSWHLGTKCVYIPIPIGSSLKK